MSGVRLFMFILALPALAVLGHDAYLFYLNQSQGFMLSATGFLWTRYHPESFTLVKDSVEPQTWENIAFILEQKALFVALGFAFFFYFIIAILQLLRVGPFRRERSSFSGNARLDDVLGRGDKKRRKL
jgi:hypothetical protein